MATAAPQRVQLARAGVLAVLGLACWALAILVLTAPEDGTDGVGMLGMSIGVCGLGLMAAAVGALVDRRRSSRGDVMAPPGWYRVESRGGESMWWDGKAWADPGSPDTGSR